MANDDDQPGPAFGNSNAVALHVVVPPDQDGKTAVAFLAWKIRRLGDARALSVVQSGDVRRLDPQTGQDVALQPHDLLRRGDALTLWRIAPDHADAPMPEPRILFEDEALVVLDKPADVAVHPSARYLHRTITGWLLRAGKPANPCHRLDRETSGVLVCARRLQGSNAMERKLKMAFQRGAVSKEYIAVVRGAVRAPFVVDTPLALQGERGLVRIRMIADPAGQSARTTVVPERVVHLADGTARTLVRCTPEGGRQHQIRAHTAHAGFPICGDKLYAMGDAWFDAFTRHALLPEDEGALDHPRQALHAISIAFPDEGLRYEAPLPADFARLLDAAPADAPRP